MQLRQLGATNLWITPIGLGCWQFSQARGLIGSFWGHLTQEVIDAIVTAALQGGINWFDTAEAYGRGRSETALATALTHAGRVNGDVLIATKWWPWLRGASSMATSAEQRLAHLGGFGIDLFQVHTARGSLSSHRAQMEGMAKLLEAGRIKSIGVSNFSATQMRLCHAVLRERNMALATNQVAYSLLDRRIESNGVLDVAEELGITIIAYSPLAQGLLAGAFHEDPDAIKKRPGPRRYLRRFRPRGLEQSAPIVTELQRLAQKYSATPSQVALNWLVSFHGETVVAIPGATKVRHAIENATALTFELAAADIKKLDELSRPFL